MAEKKYSGISFFERYLTVWVALCIIVGVLIGQFIPVIPNTLGKPPFTYEQISIPIAVLIWLMIYPMMLKIDFSSIVKATKNPKGLTVTTVVNWLIKPFTMYVIAAFFLKVVFQNLIDPDLASDYLAGAIILGAAPCTAMVFVWSHLTKGNPAYTVVQVAVNDLILLFAFVPIVALLLGQTEAFVPFGTLTLSVVLFVVIPLTLGYLSRVFIIRKKGIDYLENVYIKKFGNVTIVGLLLTLILIFTLQGSAIIDNPLHIGLISVPLIIQTVFIFLIAYLWAKVWKLPHDIAAPGAMIGASNFFELAVAVAIALFGAQSGATLATVVGVLVEVPLMLALVKIANSTRKWFAEPKPDTDFAELHQ
ncbi:ACR3 family arsenite efflux transporter [Haloplasma contractile]|uniref:Arsenical-resistance protein n=1 Tax=Haloplasma contractile SSD-17B TaxID=1033810 RepID=F7PUZ5_9MOLU|nr:ACR3 family arsenite efflux transporter [Haloplasma contractile]ERJ11230.1 Arsenical-resistance protein [Haloplasma contractile SSD-17B]